MNEKVILIKAKGDQKWNIKTTDFSLWNLLADTIEGKTRKDFEYIEIKPCCCIIERLVFLEDIEKYGLTKEEVPEEFIIV